MNWKMNKVQLVQKEEEIAMTRAERGEELMEEL